MSALREAAAQNSKVDLTFLAGFFWGWYHKHADDIILKKKVLFFTATFRVRDLDGIFLALFGPDPIVGSQVVG